MKSRAERPVTFLASISELASTSVVQGIGQHRYDAIKRTDDHPMFVQLRVGHEGISTGTITIGRQVKATPKRWFRAAVQELADRLNFGTPALFGGNHKDRGNPNRPRLGDVLAGFSRDNARGEAEAVGIAYVSDAETRGKVSSGQYDCCSIEADIIIAGLDSDEPYIEAVPVVSGVCLASSNDETPGFEGAGVEAVISELRGGIDEMADDKKVEGQPSAHFTRNQLLEDPVVKTLIDEGRNNTYQDYRREKERADKLEGEKTRLEGEKQAMETQLKEAGASVNIARINKELGSQVDALKLTKAEKDLIRKRLDGKVSVEDPKASDDDVKKAVETAIKPEAEHMMDLRKLYGKPPEAGASGKQEDADDAGGGDGGDGGNDGDGLEDDANDPFLKDNPVEKD